MIRNVVTTEMDVVIKVAQAIPMPCQTHREYREPIMVTGISEVITLTWEWVKLLKLSLQVLRYAGATQTGRNSVEAMSQERGDYSRA